MKWDLSRPDVPTKTQFSCRYKLSQENNILRLKRLRRSHISEITLMRASTVFGRINRNKLQFQNRHQQRHQRP